MPKHEYESLREEDRALIKLQSHLLCHLHLHDCELEKCVSLEWSEEAVLRRREATAFECVTCFQVLFNQETVDFYWMVVFIQSMIVFLVSSVYLVAGIFVAYSAPHRHGFLKVVENSYCASRKGILSSLALYFSVPYMCLPSNPVPSAISYDVSTFETLGSSEFLITKLWILNGLLIFLILPLVSSWGLVVLYAGTAFFLRRRAALTNDEGEFGNRNHQGLEMLEANPLEFTPDVERKHGWIHLCYHLMKKTNLKTELTKLLPVTDHEMIVDPEDKSEQVASRSVEVVDIKTGFGSVFWSVHRLF
ncbi:hypothetical protein HID58_013114 [Brassica napus]|uniref:Uncharacterized protein n=2 Tax=Brassica napus TaxID=3708 RepID=A0ABQ8E301_BRANA|nr:hypothetical protein HID58_013114 [Brassica napus]